MDTKSQKNDVLNGFMKIEHHEGESFPLQQISDDTIYDLILLLREYKNLKRRTKFIKGRYSKLPKNHAKLSKWRNEYKNNVREMVQIHIQCIKHLIQSK